MDQEVIRYINILYSAYGNHVCGSNHNDHITDLIKALCSMEILVKCCNRGYFRYSCSGCYAFWLSDDVRLLYLLSFLSIILITWYAMERTLDVHNITTLRREIFYWATVLATFMLGTALGDFTAMSLNLGNLVSGFMFIGLIAIPALAYKVFGMNEVFAFWFAYIITRPLGASFADWLVITSRGLGTGPVSLVSIIIIIALVAYVSFTIEKKLHRILYF